jgi:hypothetical protein
MSYSRYRSTAMPIATGTGHPVRITRAGWGIFKYYLPIFSPMSYRTGVAYGGFMTSPGPGAAT